MKADCPEDKRVDEKITRFLHRLGQIDQLYLK